MMKKRKQYSKEFKTEAVMMVKDQGRSIDDVCQSLSIGQTALRRWIKLHGTDPNSTNTSVGSMTETAENLRIKELEKQVKTLQKERDLLKKSISFFAREIDL
jgi:transposase